LRTPSSPCTASSERSDECGSPFDLGPLPLVREVDLCNLDINRDFVSTPCNGGAIGADAVLSFFNGGSTPQVEICAFASPLSALTFLGQQCSTSSEEQCLPTDGRCVTVTASDGQNHIVWRGEDDGSCENLTFDIRTLGGGVGDEGGSCLDGIDNNANALTDCFGPGSAFCQQVLGPDFVCNTGPIPARCIGAPCNSPADCIQPGNVCCNMRCARDCR